MEIGIAGWAFNRSILRDRTLTLLDLPRLVRQELGLGTLELVSTFFENQSAKYLNQLREEIARQQLRVANIAVDTGTLAAADPAARRTDLEAIGQWFHVARAVGAEAIRVNTGQAEPGDRDALARVVDGYRELAEHAEQSRVRLLIENHGGVSSDPEHIARILEDVPSSWFGTCPDVSNFAGDTWEQGMRVMAPRAVAVHVKCHGYDPSGLQRWRGRDGTPRSFDLKRSLAILAESGYAGPLNFEGNSAEDDEREGARKGIAYTRQLLAAL
jgi:sugar phosphate isomerase/epimerase